MDEREAPERGPRKVPGWYEDAKLGVFVHWGPYSVPGWAPISGDIQEIFADKGPRDYFVNNPYAEWYLNTMRIQGSPTWSHHRSTYGEDVPYEHFAQRFQCESAGFDPSAWAALFAKAQARYVVFTSKHMDGFELWPSTYQASGHGSESPVRQEKTHDWVGAVSEAVRAAGMRMGLYYCGGFDARFESRVIRTLGDCVLAVPESDEYARCAEAHVRELVERYQPAILWNDVGFPASVDLEALLSAYYEVVPDGVANDRWAQFPLPRPGTLKRTLTELLLHHGDRIWPLLPRRHRRFGFPASPMGDFRTPEYEAPDVPEQRKWELARGLGNSFGFNREEGDLDTLSLQALIHMLIDVVSKNGNLLIGVSPMADGTIPQRQRERLEGLGAWLDVNGESIFGTRPWKKAETLSEDGRSVRFTQSGDSLFATVLSPARAGDLTLAMRLRDESQVVLLGQDTALQWRQVERGVAITLPTDVASDGVAHSLRITPEPHLLG